MNAQIQELAKLYLLHTRYCPYGETVEEDYYEFLPEELTEFVEAVKQAIYDQVRRELIDDEAIDCESDIEDRCYLRGCNGGIVDALCIIKNFGNETNE